MGCLKQAASKKRAAAAGIDVEAAGEQQQQESADIEFKRAGVAENIPKGYRLATFNEVETHRSELLFSDALKRWDISQLLDGWIDGPGYTNRPVREFRPNLGNCILVHKSPNEGDEDAWTKLDEEGQRIAFLFACEKGFKAATPFLQKFRGKIEAGPDIAGKNCSPLHAAILGGDFDLCCTLVQSGADVNRALESRQARLFNDAMGREKIRDVTGATPLHLALAFGRDKFVLECLLKSEGLNLQALDAANRTALHYAAVLGQVAIFEALVSSRQIDLRISDKDGLTPLHIAAAAGNSALLDILLQSGDRVDFMAPDTDGKNALHFAAASGNLGNVKALTPRMKQAIRQPDKSGKIPLIYAIDSYQPRVISELLENDVRRFQDMGAVVIGQWITLKTPLHYAVYTTRKKGRAADHNSMLMPLLQHATFRTREMFHLFWDENALLYRHAKHVKVQQLLAKFLPNRELDESKGSSSDENYSSSSHSSPDDKPGETSLQRAAKAGLVHLTHQLLDKEPESLQDLNSSSWTKRLTDKENEVVLNVKRFCYIELMHKAGGSASLIEEFRRQATDQPSLDDCLGRRALVEGLAALLLNPYTGTPLTIGIYGEWGHGKSSLMQQVEVVLCTIAIQQAFIRPLQDKSNLTDKGKMVIKAVAKAVKKLVGEDKIKKNGADSVLVGA